MFRGKGKDDIKENQAKEKTKCIITSRKNKGLQREGGVVSVNNTYIIIKVLMPIKDLITISTF